MNVLYHDHFLRFLIYFNENEDYFECHEELEAYWKSIPQFSKDHPLTCYILLATSLYHWRRNNFSGALRTMNKAHQKLANLEHNAFTAGISYQNLFHQTTLAQQAIQLQQPFFPIKIELTDSILVNEVENYKCQLPLLPRNSIAITEKHRLREKP